MNENGTKTTPALVEIRLTDVAGPKRYDYDGEPIGSVTIGDLVAENIAAQLVNEIRDHVKPQVEALVADRVAAQVDEWVRAALSEPIKRTNEYGRAIGEPKSMPEFVGEQVAGWFNKPADSYNHRGQTRLQKVIADEVDSKLESEMTDAIRQAKAQIVRAVSTRSAELLSEAIRTANLLDGVR